MIDRRDDRALYQQLADHLRNAVQQGVYAPGGFLPSETALTVRYGVSRTAVRKAVAILRQEGLVTVARGMRTMVRQPARRREVTVSSGDELISRMPTEHERIRHDMDAGVPMLEIKRHNGTVELFAADQVVITGPTL